MKSVYDTRDSLIRVDDELLYGRVTAYAVTQSEEGGNFHFFEFHLNCRRKKNDVIAAIEKELPKTSMILAVLWVNDKNEKRLFVLGEKLLRRELEIHRTWNQIMHHRNLVAA